MQYSGLKWPTIEFESTVVDAAFKISSTIDNWSELLDIEFLISSLAWFELRASIRRQCQLLIDEDHI